MAIDVNGHVDRHAGAQRHVRLLGPGDAHRNALHHLHEVARRVVRRQQREAGAGAAREALDGAFESSCPDRRRSSMSAVWPGFILPICVSLKLAMTYVVVGHQLDHRRADGHELAFVHRQLRGDAVGRRLDRGVAELQPRQLELRLGRLDARVRQVGVARARWRSAPRWASSGSSGRAPHRRAPARRALRLLGAPTPAPWPAPAPRRPSRSPPARCRRAPAARRWPP